MAKNNESIHVTNVNDAERALINTPAAARTALRNNIGYWAWELHECGVVENKFKSNSMPAISKRVGYYGDSIEKCRKLGRRASANVFGFFVSLAVCAGLLYLSRHAENYEFLRKIIDSADFYYSGLFGIAGSALITFCLCSQAFSGIWTIPAMALGFAWCGYLAVAVFNERFVYALFALYVTPVALGFLMLAVRNIYAFNPFAVHKARAEYEQVCAPVRDYHMALLKALENSEGLDGNPVIRSAEWKAARAYLQSGADYLHKNQYNNFFKECI